MKTSNKILSGFFILLFLTPLLISMVLRSKIKNNQFTVNTENNIHRQVNRSLNNVRNITVIDSVNSDYRLQVSLHYSEIPSYNNYALDQRNDSIQIEQRGENLFIKHIGIGHSVESPAGSNINDDIRKRNMMIVNLYIPFVPELNVSGANLYIDQFPKSIITSNIKIINKGMLFLGAEADDTDKPENIMELGRMNITTDSSSLNIRSFVHLENVSLRLSAGSSLTINPESKLDTISGSVSPNVDLKVSAHHLSKIVPLFKQIL